MTPKHPGALAFMAITSRIRSSAATWNVQNFGATGNGTTDDTAAIQKAVNSTAAGDTILFPSGSYRLSAPINVHSSRTYQGQSRATLLGVSGSYTFATPWDATSNITINGLIFDGAPLAIQGDKVPASNVQITNCTFQNITSTNNNWTTHQGIFIASGLTDSSITNNTFRNILPNGQTNDTETSWGAGIFGNNIKNTVISGNTCDTVQQCMYFKTDAASTYPGIVISNNTGTNVHRMGIEMQAANCSVQMTGNKFTNFLNPFWDTFGISFAASTCDAVIENNTLIAMPTATTFGRYGYGIEAWGTGTQVTNNSIQGYWTLGVAIGWSTNLSVTNNYLCGSTGAMTVSNETGWPISGTRVQGNTTSLVCSTTQPPSVTLTQPAPNTILSGTVAMAANASSPSGISVVQFYVDSTQMLGQGSTPPYAANFDTTTVGNGTHALTAIATDSTGLKTTSAPVSISVQNIVQSPPTVTLTQPAPNTVLSGIVAVAAYASSATASISVVQFSLDNAQSFGQAGAAPYTVNLDTTTASNGTHSLTATAVDSNGMKTTSAPVSISIQNSIQSPPATWI